MIRILDYFYILRPMLFFPGWTTTLAGVLAARDDWSLTMPHWGTWNWHLVIVGISSAMVMGSGFAVNQLRDIETDRVNKKLFLLAGGFLTRRAVIMEAALLAVGSLILASLISPMMTAAHVISLFIITVLYNLKPFEWKNKPIGSSMANTLMGFFAFAFGWLLQSHAILHGITASLPYVFFNTSLCILTMIPDMEGDKAASKSTLSVRYGKRWSLRIAMGFELLAIAFGIGFQDPVAIAASALTLPFFTVMVFHETDAWVIRTVKFGIFFFSMAVMLYFPAYLIVMIAIFFLTRWYYRNRFQFDYPNFRGQ